MTDREMLRIILSHTDHKILEDKLDWMKVDSCGWDAITFYFGNDDELLQIC